VVVVVVEVKRELKQTCENRGGGSLVDKPSSDRTMYSQCLYILVYV
jgi:hypothetical protein